MTQPQKYSFMQNLAQKAGLVATLAAVSLMPSSRANITNAFKQTAPTLTGALLMPTTASEREKTYQKLNNLLNDPVIPGVIVAINPDDYKNPTALMQGIEQSFNQRTANASTLDKQAAQEVINFYRKDLEKTGFSNIVAKAIHVQLTPQKSGGFACLAVGPQIGQSLQTEKQWLQIRQKFHHAFPGTPRNDFIAHEIDSNEATAKLWHEVGHCLNGYQELPQETQLQAYLRKESTADAFSVLFRIQNKEANILAKIKTLQQRRLMDSIDPGARDFKHDTSHVLALIIQNYPNLTKKLSNMPIRQVGQLAAHYSDTAIKQIYTPGVSGKIIDERLEGESDFVSNLVFSAYPKTTDFPKQLTPFSALRILRLAEGGACFNQYQSGYLAGGMEKLYEKFPRVMQDAKIAYKREQKSGRDLLLKRAHTLLKPRKRPFFLIIFCFKAQSLSWPGAYHLLKNYSCHDFRFSRRPMATSSAV